jgi:hypothetical protein
LPTVFLSPELRPPLLGVVSPEPPQKPPILPKISLAKEESPPPAVLGPAVVVGVAVGVVNEPPPRKELKAESARRESPSREREAPPDDESFPLAEEVEAVLLGCPD